MFNPHFDKVFAMCQTIAKVHSGEIEVMKLEWIELKDADGDVYQIVPALDIVYK